MIHRKPGAYRHIELDDRDASELVPFMTRGTREVVNAVAAAEKTKPEVIISQWIAERAEYEKFEEQRQA